MTKARMKKDYMIGEITLDWFNKNGLGNYLIETIEGGLLDNYLIDFSGLRYGRVRRKYMIVVSEYRNEWSSAMVAVLTDDEEKANKFIDLANEYYDDEECYPSLEGMFFKSYGERQKESFEKAFGIRL
ncbi:hypothetical protein SY212_04210 [Ligilactobacillus agilis]|uniref:Uncharacterized protein n=1 Tax=Ligilactobacillus agilis TaxID=1601 RepID=A0A6F9XJE9_9LACO|nr:hypothetical protein [Ligilactobacillus agilis]GET05391.1 hypothetical protein SY212_04210 [Ligilactobacillus agilis]